MTCKGRMTDDLIAVTDLEGRSVNERRASSELAMHLLIYGERPDVKAVCHAHPPHGTAFAVAGVDTEHPIHPPGVLPLPSARPAAKPRPPAPPAPRPPPPPTPHPTTSPIPHSPTAP